jgi:RNA polymerase sigma-70 factor (ECF subfamily)
MKAIGITRGGSMEVEQGSRSDLERRSFERLIRPELTSAYRLAGYLMADASAAEDAAQEAVLRAWQAFPRLRDESQFRSWFQRIVANVCHDQMRRRRIVAFVPLDDPQSEPDDPFRSSLDRIALGRALATLTAEHRVVVVLRYLLDLTNEEIADRLQIPKGTVKSRLHYAFVALRRELDHSTEVVR